MKTKTNNATITEFERATINNNILDMIYYKIHSLVTNISGGRSVHMNCIKFLKYRASFQDIGHPGILLINYDWINRLYLIITDNSQVVKNNTQHYTNILKKYQKKSKNQKNIYYKNKINRSHPNLNRIITS